jgi:uncharacterized protein YutE (UPF0331/DUF86 family)
MVDPGRVRTLLDRLAEELSHLRAPTSFADAFAVLGEAGFVDAGLVPALQEMARFRNLLVHGYLRVDDRRVVEILRTRLDDLDAFRSQAARSALGEG